MSMMQNIGIKALYDSSGIKDKIDCFHLGYVLGPRINAGGRVGKADLGADLLSINCPLEAKKIASELEKHNNERKVIELTMQEEAIEIAQGQLNNKFLFIVGNGWHPGVIGIVAARLKEKYDKPVAVIALNDGIGKASCRSIKNIDFGVKILKAKEQELLLSGGGHAMAAGFTVKEESLTALQNYLENLFAEDFAKINIENFSEYNFELTTSSLNDEFLAELAKLEPYGVGNYEPLFKITNLFVLKADIVGNKHIKCTLAPSRGSHGYKAIKAIAFNSVDTEFEKVLLSRKPLDIDAIGIFKQNIWQGVSYLQMQIKDLIVNDL